MGCVLEPFTGVTQCLSFSRVISYPKRIAHASWWTLMGTASQDFTFVNLRLAGSSMSQPATGQWTQTNQGIHGNRPWPPPLRQMPELLQFWWILAFQFWLSSHPLHLTPELRSPVWSPELFSHWIYSSPNFWLSSLWEDYKSLPCRTLKNLWAHLGNEKWAEVMLRFGCTIFSLCLNDR